jgi:hypothetical protein
MDPKDPLPAIVVQGPVVVTCMHGGPRSHGAAALLRQVGVEAEVVEGGFAAWRDKNFPVVPPEFAGTEDGGRLWVTRARPKIDRIACPWLIRRFVENVRWSHVGERCSFETMVEGFGLSGPVLDRMGVIVRGADTGALDLAPEAAGLLALSLGLSRQYANDLEQLEAGLVLYDALYRWARDASTEKHEWIEGRQK